MKKTTIPALFLAASAMFSNYVAADTDFYVVGHADDWQLFMNPNAYNSLQGSGNKAVFIHTTAGDAGSGGSDRGRPEPYYLAREEGALRAVRFMVNTNNGNRGEAMASVIANFSGHNIIRYEYANAVLYFLRTPDGNPSGSGYSGTNYESLEQLYLGNNTLSAVNGSTTYQNWTDLTNTLQAIVEFEADGDPTVSFNIADSDNNINPGDHSDHLYTSKAMEDVANALNCVDINYFQEYQTRNHANNLSGNDYLIEVGTWAATTSGISDHYHNSTWDGGHNAWLGKNYYRTVYNPNNCNLSNNIASLANVYASSQNVSTAQTADKAIDGVRDGWPNDYTKEWASVNGRAGQYISLNWPHTVTIDHVVLVDRPNLNDQVLSGRLRFSDGSTVSVSSLNNSGAGNTITLATPKSTQSLIFVIDSVSSSTSNIGLSEIEVYGQY